MRMSVRLGSCLLIVGGLLNLADRLLPAAGTLRGWGIVGLFFLGIASVIGIEALAAYSKARSVAARHRYRIAVNDHEVSLIDDFTAQTRWHLQWSDVCEISAWKIDLFSYDSICVGFRTNGEDALAWCTEEDRGWDDLLAAMERVLNVKSETWWSRVAFPAFETNWTILWTSADVRVGV